MFPQWLIELTQLWMRVSGRVAYKLESLTDCHAKPGQYSQLTPNLTNLSIYLTLDAKSTVKVITVRSTGHRITRKEV